MNSRGGGGGLGPRIYRGLLRVLPRHFRSDAGEEMAATFEAIWASRPAAVRWWITMRMSAQLLRVALAEWLEAFWSPGGSWRALLDGLRLDAGFALRSLRRDAGLAVVVISLVGIGIGSAVTVFSVAQTLLFKPLPFAEPAELVYISNGVWGRGQELSRLSAQVVHVRDLQQQSQTLSGVEGFHLFDRVHDHLLAGDGPPERLTRLRVTPGFFALLGVSMAHGSDFTPAQAAEGGPPSIILSDAFWRRRFAGDPRVVGRALTIDDTPVTVVGVLPPAFDFASIFAPGTVVDYVAPWPLTDRNNRTGNSLALIGRLAPGMSVDAAQREVQAIADRAPDDGRNTFDPWVTPLRARVSGHLRAATSVLVGAVGLLLLVVCANVASLLLARAAARRREIAIRAALGANRGRLIRQVLTESLLFSVGGVALGLVLAFAGVEAIARLDLGVPLLQGVRVDGWALVFGAATTAATALLFGLAPAIDLARTPTDGMLGEGGRGASAGPSAGRLRALLVVGEVALTCVMLVGTGLLGRSLVELMRTDLGFTPERAFATRVDPGSGFASIQEQSAYFDVLLTHLRATPGAEAVGLTDVLPVGFNRRWCSNRADVPEAEGRPCVDAFIRLVTEGYREAMGLSVVAGRAIRAEDDAAAVRVAVVNDALAAMLWPGEDPVGRILRTSGEEYTVVGVTRGMRHLHPDQQPGPELFLSLRQVRRGGEVHAIVRSSRTADVLAPVVGTSLRSFQASLPFMGLRPIEGIVSEAFTVRRVVVSLLVGFAGFSLLLASLGLYALIAHTVVARRRELGIRMALGAAPSVLRGAVLGGTLRLAAIGTAVGVGVALVLSGLLRSLVYGVPTTDPVTFVAVPAVVMLVAAVAGAIPAHRAASVDPVEVLAAEG